MAAPDHIVFICSGLDTPGGIERAIVNTANLFRTRKHPVSVLVMADTVESFYPIDPTISMQFYPLHFGIRDGGNTVVNKMQFTHHIIRLRALLKSLKPDLVITTEYQFTIAAAIAWRSRRVISWEHHHYAHLPMSGFWRALYNVIYPRLRRIIALNASEGAYYTGMNWKVSVIPNFIVPGTGFWRGERKKVLLTVGWLTPTKGIELVPAIASIVFKNHPEWRWEIIGRGPGKRKLIENLHALELSDRVSIIEPASHDLSPLYRTASLYVMPSKFECFPMVLLEAMSHGVPAIAFDCATGPKHMISDGEDGVLVPAGNVEAMSAAIIRLIENDEQRRSMSANAARNIQRFTPEKSYALWDDVFTAR